MVITDIALHLRDVTRVALVFRGLALNGDIRYKHEREVVVYCEQLGSLILRVISLT